MKRHPVNKQKSAATFRNHTRKTKAANMRAPGPMRGGIRL